MSVYDRWHKTHPGEDEPACRTHKMVPSAEHGRGKRWQVRWYDDTKQQRSRNFVKKEGKDPELHADAFDAKVNATLDDDTYVDHRTGNSTFREYAEGWRTARTHGETTAIGVEGSFRLHVYPDPATPGRTPRGGPALGHHRLAELAKRPSLSQAWIAGMPLEDSTKLGVINRVSEVFTAAVEDGLIPRNPLHSKSVTRPKPGKHEAVPLTLAEVEALSLALRHYPGCGDGCDACGLSPYEIIPFLGAGTGMRQGEMFALDTEKDMDWLRRTVRVRRQVKITRGKQVFAPLKNDKIHDVPLTDALAALLARHMQLFPPARVTLPWKKAGGDPRTFTLLLSRPGDQAMHRQMANVRWRAALVRAGIEADRWHMMHVLRHTAASAWLSEGMSIGAVAEFLGDTEAVVQSTYSHLMPDDRDRARKAMERFFTPGAGVPADSPGALSVP